MTPAPEFDPGLPAALQAHGIGHFGVDGSGVITSLNQHLRSWTGWDANHAVGKPALTMLDPGAASAEPTPHAAGARGTLARAMASRTGQPSQCLADLRCENGETVSVHLSLQSLASGGCSVVVVRLDTAADTGNGETAEPTSLIGTSGAMAAVKRSLLRAAQSSASVLITGESGTGKELAARAIHEHSTRRDRPFVAVNCAAFQPTLLESELFGHVRGAFTGADAERTGLIAHADGGTLFLDEVGEISPELQAKLLRVLQERELRPVGANEPIEVDVRLVSATHRQPDELLSSGQLRADFYYRIRVLELTLPPLRDRTEDIPQLVGAFLRQLEPDRRRTLTREALGCLQAYPWPGNVRQLRNAIEHATVAATGDVLTPAALPREILRAATRGRPDNALGDQEARERDRIRDALELFGWNRTRAAEALGMSRVTLWKKIRRYRLDPTPFRGR